MSESQASNQSVQAERQAGERIAAKVGRREAIEKANHLATEERFVYRGSAVGVAARFEAPRELLIPAQASCCLPGGGGLAEGLVEGFDEPDLLSFSRARCRAEGLEFKGEGVHRFRTTVEASVEGLNIAGHLKADKLSAALVSRHGPDSDQAEIVPGDMPRLQSFQLDGHEIRVEFALDVFTKYGSLKKLRRAYVEDDQFFEEFGHLFFNHKARKRKKGFVGWLEKKLGKKNRKLPVSSGYLLCNIVRRIDSSHPQAKVYGNVVELPGFGRIYLGEMIIDGDTRRLALLRFKLDPGNLDSGSNSQSGGVFANSNGGTKGDGEAGCVGTNGHCYP